MEKETFAQNMRAGLCDALDVSLASVCAKARDWGLTTAPQVAANCERLAVYGPRLSSEFFRAGANLSALAMQDWEGALRESNRLVSEMLKVTLKGQVNPYDLTNFFFQMAKGFSEASNLARQCLEEFKEQKFRILAGYVLYPHLAQQFKVHELSSLKVGDRYLNLSDPREYTVGISLLLAFGRPDVIQKGLHFRLSNQVSISIIKHRYVEVGGEQHILESFVKSSLDKNWQMVENVPFLTGARQAAADVIDKATSFAKKKRQQWECQVLAEMERLKKLSQLRSLDVPVVTEEGESVPLAELMPSEPNLMEAELAYYEAVSKLPDERMRRIFRRVWEEGETPQQAAIKLGYPWTSASERQVERMIKEIYKEMLS